MKVRLGVAAAALILLFGASAVSAQTEWNDVSVYAIGVE